MLPQSANPPAPARLRYPCSKIACFILVSAIVLIYYPVWFSEFVWDDYVIINPANLESLSALFKIWFSPAHAISGDYWPLDYTSHWVEFQLWGLDSRGYHAVNVFLHAANTLAVFFLLGRMGFRSAFPAAFLFAIHPMQVSSVAWVVERKDLLNTFFYLLAFQAWIWFEEKPSISRYCTAALLFICAMLSKSMSVTWPAAVLLYLWWRSGSIRRDRALALIPLQILAFPLAFLCRIAASFTGAAVGNPHDYSRSHSLLSFAEKIILTGKNLCYYAGKLFWPVEHCPFYPKWDLSPGVPANWGCFAAASAFIILLWTCRRRWGNAPFAAAAFYVITLSPVLGMVHWSLLKFAHVQDHYQYLACLALFIPAAHLFDRYAPAIPAGRYAGVVAWGLFYLLTFLSLGLIARAHVLMYHDEETLMCANNKSYPGSVKAASGCADAFLAKGKPLDALTVCEKCLAASPDMSILRKNADDGTWAGPENSGVPGGVYRKAFDAATEVSILLQVKGDALIRLGRLEEARAAYEKALSLPNFHKSLCGRYALLLMTLAPPQPDRVLAAKQNTLKMTPSDPNLLLAIGLAHGARGERERAQEYYLQALRFAAGVWGADGYYRCGKGLFELGEYQKAVPALRQASEIERGQNTEYREMLERARNAAGESLGARISTIQNQRQKP